MKKLKRTHYCGELSKENEGQSVIIFGFVQKLRNLGNLLFIDVRDRSGIVQLAIDGNVDQKVFNLASEVRAEYVIAACGVVRIRSAINHDISTGMIEIYVSNFEILSRAQTPPFEITDKTSVNEELRLKYRYLDLRRSEMQQTLKMRHKIVKAARDYYDKHGFLEIETPILIKSTPEGARDYLVPSRVHPGSFFALPQSPQLYKQLLMLSGYDRYMQIARCFRDEDLRADRQPEFTQIDMEMSFVDEDEVMAVNEGFIIDVFKKILNINLDSPFKRITYDEAMKRFGSDKPDMRFALELVDITDIFSKCKFKVFSDAIMSGGSIRAINVNNSANILTRKEIDKLVEVVKTYKAKGLAFSRYTSDGISSSFEKFLNDEEIRLMHEKLNFSQNDVILIVADKNNVVFDSLGSLRCHIAEKLNLVASDKFNFVWVTDFPLFEYDDEQKRYVSKHHPFTCPRLNQVDELETNPGEVKACAYDMVLNGCEIGGGSIRIHDQDLQQKVFKILGFSQQESKEKFGFLLDAFQYGVPPHGGMAYGLDRLVMLMLGKTSIRDVIAFPKVQNSSELMTSCPSIVDDINLKELHIKIDK